MTLSLTIDHYTPIHDLLVEHDLILPPDWFTAKSEVVSPAPLWTIYSTFGKKKISPAEWGMNPNWARNGQIPRQLNIARAETVFERVSFKALIKRYRAIIPVNAFKVRSSNKDVHGKHQYFSFSDKAEDALCLAVLYQFNADGNMQVVLLTKAVRVTELKKTLRMPLVIASAQADDWLANEKQNFIESFLEDYSLPVALSVKPE